MTRHAIVIAVAASALALAAGACGSSGGQSSSGSSPSSSTSSGGDLVHISMKGLRFHPAAITAHAGQTVVWTNEEAVDHNVTADSGAGFHTRAFGQGHAFRFRLRKAGLIRYECTLHPGMRGTITVR